MYEQYTDKQIVEMLVPKLMKAVPSVDWNMVIANAGCNWRIIQAIGFVYRSAYIRGRKGRSFIIGEPKQTEHWVPATKDNIKVGSKVRMIDEEAHASSPDCYPSVGTVGVVIDNNICRILPLIQWPRDSVGNDDVTHCLSRYLEVLVCE